jgi:hypothetical protein
MARRVIRPTADWNNRIGSKPAKWTMDRSKWNAEIVYRIEWPDGTPTDTGLFSSVDWAQRYANDRGWPVDVEDDEREVCA